MRTFHAIALLLALPVWVPAADAPIDFAKDIQPILAQHCVACHGAEKTKGHFRLDVKALAMDGGTSGKAILPGQGAK